MKTVQKPKPSKKVVLPVGAGSVHKGGPSWTQRKSNLAVILLAVSLLVVLVLLVLAMPTSGGF